MLSLREYFKSLQSDYLVILSLSEVFSPVIVFEEPSIELGSVGLIDPMLPELPGTSSGGRQLCLVLQCYFWSRDTAPANLFAPVFFMVILKLLE